MIDDVVAVLTAFSIIAFTILFVVWITALVGTVIFNLLPEKIRRYFDE